MTLGFVALLLGALLLAVEGPGGLRFINPGPLSTPHRSAAFATLAAGRLQAPSDCAACHPAAREGFGGWWEHAKRSQPSMLSPAQFQSPGPGPLMMTALDRQACATCHTQHEFHQPNITHAASCSQCHAEHRGAHMPAPQDARCADCHDSAAMMIEASLRGAGMESRRFDPLLPATVRVFDQARPAGGRTNVFATFWQGHPDFGPLRPGVTEQNGLKFNHALHLGSTVRDDGEPLQCASCHVPTPDGAYFSRVRFEAHCQRCHQLQFDPIHPSLTLPHGDVAAARSQLRGLPLAYVELARQSGLTRKEDIDRFAQTNLARLRSVLGSGEALEERVFFTSDWRQPGSPAGARAFFAGCAYCHEVSSDPAQFARVTPVTVPDRWFRAGRFSHRSHVQWDCTHCHNSGSSTRSADVSLPHQATCAACHSPAGGAPHGCAVCHTYHLGRGGK